MKDRWEKSRIAARRHAAQLIGVSDEEYEAKTTAGLKWCGGCKSWQPLDLFCKDKSRPSGLGTRCVKCRQRRSVLNWEKLKLDPVRIARKRKRELMRGRSHRRRSIVIPKQIRDDRMDEYQGNCAYCGKPAQSWDHIVPVAKGGTEVPWNIVPACISCNSSKQDKDLLVWIDQKGLIGTWMLWEQVAGWISC